MPLVICLTVLIVVGVNAVLLVALRRGNEASQIDLLKRAAGRVRQPWIHEDKALKELSELVADLRKNSREHGSRGAEVQRSGGEEERRQSTSQGRVDQEHHVDE